jgi:hypothetical protein
MCCFADTVEHVAETHIFAAMSGAEQVLVYDARVKTKTNNAMILPVPVRTGTQANIQLIDMSRHADFFDVLASMFPEAAVSGGLSAGPTLEVVRVGAFEASIVPTLDDIHRLSSRFTIGASGVRLWGRKRTVLDVFRERYADHAFVVYQIATGETRLHPFAFRFTSRYPYIFFPTLHVHDGDAPAEAHFDHVLYAQRATLYEQSAGAPWQVAPGGLPSFVDPNAPVVRALISGLYPNRDSFAGLAA